MRDERVTSGFTITEVAGESYRVATGAEPEYLLFQGGRMVGSSVGARDAGWWGEGGEQSEGDYYEPTSPGQTWQVAETYTVGIYEISTCGDRTDYEDRPSPEFQTPLPAGEYDVVYAAPYRLTGAETWEIAFSDPYPITLP